MSREIFNSAWYSKTRIIKYASSVPPVFKNFISAVLMEFESSKSKIKLSKPFALTFQRRFVCAQLQKHDSRVDVMFQLSIANSAGATCY